jgi:hypothetical protein
MRKRNSYETKYTPNEYYVEEDYAWLAGPYEPSNIVHNRMLERVIADMKRGNIDYRLSPDERGRTMVERKNMILPKRKP